MAQRKTTTVASPHVREQAARHAQQQRCLALLAGLDVLRGVPSAELGRLVELATFRVFPAGSTIFSERAPAEFFHLLLQGNVRLTLHDREGHEVLVGVLGRGDCYGEGLLFGDLFRRAGVFAENDCHVLQFRLSDMRALLPDTPLLHTALRQIYRRRLAEGTLARVPLLSQLSPLERTALCGLLQPARFERGSEILRQGGRGDALYIVEVGQVAVEQQGQAIASIVEGDFFGEIALLRDQPHSATIRALTPTDVLMLPAAEFHRLLALRPDIAEQLRKVADRRVANSTALSNNLEQSQRMMQAVSRGLLRGSYLLVRTPELCPPDCRMCEEACVTRHGNQRLHLNGVTIGQFDVLDTCRQCRVGAECVAACPEDAFTWNERGVLLITDKCTGCGACIPACPYDAIDQVPRSGARDGPLWQLWETAQQRVKRSFGVIPLEPARPTHRADKCDLCQSHSDMACISACPTGSLRLVPVEELFPL
ncbi:MAG: cyclic nucleotide-binding domain-containing protein [Chloroflexaceae bacterium]|jgi:CRP-like cAMP-binding protein/NAD-dependent dihydropyrimidine dehydrogenase PreA subunit|nr:cyclic nucleotide-binding domain-containing protein [Chloroflexaceae bacterium]